MIKLLASLFITSLFIGSDYLITGEFSLLSFVLFSLLVLFLERKFLILLAMLGLIHQLFFTYFQRELQGADIYNFFTHIGETFESFFGLIMILYKPIILFSIIVIMIRPKPLTLKRRWRYPLIIILIMINLHSTLGLKILPVLFTVPYASKAIMIEETPLYPQRKPTTNIVLIIGESMKYDNYTESKLKIEGGFYKKIFAGATNTDVSVPLLLNNKTNPLTLSPKNETNLFKLAHKNHFYTTFISMQSEKSLAYIKPYLQLENIDHYQSYSKKERKEKFDFFLLDALEKIDFEKPNFLVLQQIGQHSPYHYFEGKKSDDPSENYKKSIDYSFAFYKKVYSTLQNSKKPFIMIVTSDHGEFSGEGGRWGHNTFEKTIYEVPLFIRSNQPLPQAYHDIESHHHLSQLLSYLLGYHDNLIFSKEKTIINGTMITREDGYKIIDAN